MRLSVWVNDEFAAVVRDRLPSVNISKVLQDGLRGLLKCEHDRMACADCGTPIDRNGVADEVLSNFYRQVMWELSDLVNANGTCEGAARVVKGVAESYGVSAAKRVSLPRPPRGVRERRDWDRRWLEQQQQLSF